MTDKQFPIPEVPKTYGVEQPKVEPLPPFVEPVYVPPAQASFKPYVRSTKVATVKIYTPDGDSFCLINEADFNPHEHKLWVDA